MHNTLNNENTGNFHLQAGTKETYNRKLKNYVPICLVKVIALYLLGADLTIANPIKTDSL